jgi:hypothetical protein
MPTSLSSGIAMTQVMSDDCCDQVVDCIFY